MPGYISGPLECASCGYTGRVVFPVTWVASVRIACPECLEDRAALAGVAVPVEPEADAGLAEHEIALDAETLNARRFQH